MKGETKGETFSGSAAAWAVIVIVLALVFGIALLTKSITVFLLSLAVILLLGAVLRSIEVGK